LIDIGSIDEGDFYVKFGLRNKVDDFHWVLIAVYGAAQEEHKEYFLTELIKHVQRKQVLLLWVEILVSLQAHRKKTTIDLRLVALHV